MMLKPFLFATIIIANREYSITNQSILFVPNLKIKANSIIYFQKLMLLQISKDEMFLGSPIILQPIVIKGIVLGSIKATKQPIFKMKIRKHYETRTTHTITYTQIKIMGYINTNIEEKLPISTKDSKKLLAYSQLPKNYNPILKVINPTQKTSILKKKYFKLTKQTLNILQK